MHVWLSHKHTQARQRKQLILRLGLFQKSGQSFENITALCGCYTDDESNECSSYEEQAETVPKAFLGSH